MTLTTQTGALRSPPGDPDHDAVAVAWSVCQQAQPMQGYLFGSRARGDYDNDSDVDIAITVEEFSSGRVKKSTLANSMAREGTLIMNGNAAGYDEESKEETVNWDDVEARAASAHITQRPQL